MARRTDTPKKLGVYENGEDFIFSIPAQSAMLIELKPTKAAASNHAAPPSNAVIQPAFVR